MHRFEVTIDGEDHELTEDNHTVNLFRDEPEYDYLVLRPEDDISEEQRTILIFRQQRLCHWLANIALNPTDQDTLDETNAEWGTFSGNFGWNSKTLIEDSANDFEKEYFVESLMGDLRRAEGADDLLG